MDAARFARIVARWSAHVHEAAVPLVVGAVITVGGLAHGGDSARPPALAAGLGAAAALAARRRAPGWTLAVSGALALLQFQLAPAVVATVVLAPAVALYSLALTHGPAARLLAGAAAITTVVVVEILHPGRPTLPQTLAHAVLVAIPLLAAEAHRTRDANVALLHERIALAERTREQEAQHRAEQERMRIARDLHDVVAHTLTAINVQAATAAELRDPEHAQAALEAIEHDSREAISELRAVLGVLRDAGAGETPLTPTPGLDDVADLVRRAREGGVDVRLDVTGERPARLAESVSLAAFRIVQESITNARRHATGAPVRVSLAFAPGGLAVCVENGTGSPAGTNGTGPGVGIVGMTERAAAIGGTLRATPLPDGFRVDAQLPYGA